MAGSRGSAGLSLRAYARSRADRGLPGGTLGAVQKAIKSGRISTLPDGKINPIEADAHWDAKASPDALTRRDSPRAITTQKERMPSASTAQPEDFQRARARREAALAEEAELRVAQKRGRLVPADEIAEAQEQIAHTVADHMLNLPARCAPEIAAASGADQREILTLLDKLVRSHLQEIAFELGMVGK
jgi:hypothetical protein